MELIGKFDITLKQKAIEDASEMLQVMYKGIAKDLYKYTQLSWRQTGKKIMGFYRHKSPTVLYLPDFEFFVIKKIHFHSPVMIDVYVQLGNLGIYRIRMIAEKKPYVTHPQAKFRYNPNSLRKVEVKN